MISVVVPLYNKAAYVRRAIESILSQTHQDFEIVVVDDGSTDGSAEIVASIGSPKCHIHRQPNGGEGAARNKGVEIARSDLIAFLDADDEWRPEFLAASLALHRGWPEIVASFTNYERSATKSVALTQKLPPGRLKSYFEFCLLNGGAGMWTGSTMVNRPALVRAGGFPVGRSMGPDLDAWFRLACQGPVAYDPRPLAVYFCDRGVTVTSRVNTDIWPGFNAWREKGMIPESEAKAAEQFAVMLRLITVAMRCHTGDTDEARQLLAELPPRRAWSFRRLACLLAAWLPGLPPRCWLGAAYRLGVQVYWPVEN